MQEVVLVSQRLVLLLEESCWEVFCWTSHLQVVKRSWWKRSINTRPKIASTSSWSFSQLNSTSSRSADTWYLLVSKTSCAPTLENTSSLISCLLAGWGWLEFPLDGCSITFVLETTTSSKLPEEFFGNLLSFLGRDLLQSESLNFVQIRDTAPYHRWRLIKSCCFNVDGNCIKWECKWGFDQLYKPMECRHDYTINGKTCAFFGSSSDVLGSDWRRYFFRIGDGLSLS